MKLIDNILYLEFSELVICGVSENTLWKAKERNSSSWHMINDPADKRRVLIGYEKLKDAYKELVKARFGNPHEYIAKEPIRKMVTRDQEAERFFLAHRYGDNKSLPVEHVKKYTTAASWLNMLVKANSDKKEIKKQLNLSIDQFYIHVMEMFKTDGVDLPTNYAKLLAKRRDYEATGYGSLVDWRFGNKNAAKIDDEVTESLLLELLSNPNQYDDVYIGMKYNEWAIANQHETITSATVGIWRRKLEYLIIAARQGRAAYYDKYSVQVKGFRPTAPLLMVESDDNFLDLLFLDIEDKTQHKYYHKYKAIVVTDSYNDYVLGYAYAENITTELVRAAYLNAMYHIRELTGNWYVPHEVKTDRWALSELQPFYSAFANYYPTPVGSKKRGYLEQFFSSAIWENALKAGANNYTGNNLTAKNRGVNIEELELSKKNRPTLDEGRVQVENFFHRLRLETGKNGKSKQDEWLEAFAATAESRKKTITDEQFLLYFGVQHRPRNGKQIKITNGGVEPQIQGVQYGFTVPPALYLTNVGKPVSIIYDPYDMSRVLVTDFASLRFTATAQRLQPRAMADYQPGDRRLLNAILAEKMDDNEKVAAAAEKRKAILRKNNVDPENMLQGGAMVKELKQAAELAYHPTIVDRDSYNPLDQM
ncbi:hypothetical protein SAMN05428988_1346 [Chitinophaga sp. YR573]|uniref:hypothetical protein n=1 Tax=Chitinophaga sp. YR573 TaxID=1881040 RepID=UPI0008B8D183|nr:hypothetical protein [Chitinophaga sp. YR573]SEW02268.1 hypothetical protein SAMN05428988_1346 [Chitinophaga sp. YR573]